jgi:hypothetical protein
VLCEKPLASTPAKAGVAAGGAPRTGVKIGEAFMVRTHPQWLRARELLREGRIGELRAVMGFFSYFNRDPANIRNVLAWGGGALIDIGCYPINTSRFIFGEEPRACVALLERDPEMHTDRLTSAYARVSLPGRRSSPATQLVPLPAHAVLSERAGADRDRGSGQRASRPADANLYRWAATCLAEALRPNHFRSATSTPFRATVLARGAWSGRGAGAPRGRRAQYGRARRAVPVGRRRDSWETP